MKRCGYRILQANPRRLKQGEVDKTDVHRRRQIDVVTASGEAVKRTAQVTQGAFLPVAIVDDLHFKIEVCLLVDSDFHVEHESLVVNGFTEDDRVCDLHVERLGIQMEQGADKPCENFCVFLQNSSERVSVNSFRGI